MDTKILSSLSDILSSFPEYWEQEELQKNKVIEDLKKYRADLIKALLVDEQIKIAYTLNVGGTNVFKLDELISVFRYRNYWENSYTKYTNKIGLTSEGKYLDYNSDVVLDFPHKDCVLEGGMSTEDVGQEEIYYNKVIAKDEVDMLTAPKAFKNIKKYDKDGTKEIPKMNDSDNLIIKGNNLLALHSLKKKYTEKVKLIYIDPPYNTKSSATTFHYNNRFNHSTWLTFMKNRMEIAKELLREDGVFVIAIDDNELFYLGVLADEIFGEFNRLGVISVVHNPGGRQDEEYFPTSHENMLVYAFNRETVKLNNLPISTEKLKEYNKTDEYGIYKTRNFRRSGNNSLKSERPKLFYPIYYNHSINKLSLTDDSESIKLLPIDLKGVNRCWRWGKETFLQKKEKYIEVVERDGEYSLFVKERESDYLGEKPKTIWNKSEYSGQTATHILNKLFDDKVFSYPKSEYLLRDVINVCTNKDDLILDFFMGSGTTQAVAHKMNRQYIGIEQMDYINEVSVPRLQKVIEGEQGGISKDVDWQGGGSFIYAELYDLNNEFIVRIREAKNQKELNAILDKIKTSAYLNFKVELNKITTSDEEFQALSLEDQKKVFIELLDMNQLYLNYSEISDTQYDVSDEVKKFNDSFYQKGDLVE